MRGAASEPQSSRRVSSWRRGIAILIVGGLLAVGLLFGITFDEGHGMMASLSACALTIVVFTWWFVTRSPAPALARWSWFAIVLALVGCVRITGCQGGMTPRVAWAWSIAPDRKLAANAPSSIVPATAVDLTPTSSRDFPRFLGADGLATVRGVRLARDWQAQSPKLLWRQAIGAGWSSFAVVGDYAVTQEQRGDDELVVCYRWRTGDQVWTHSERVRHETVMGGIGPRATPTIHQGRVLAMGATGILNALDGATGKPLWTHRLLDEFSARMPDWGKSCSPLVVGDLAIVSIGGDEQRAVAAFHLADGSLAWKSGDDETSFATPVRATLCGAPQIVMLNAASVTAHDPQTGKQLWRFDWPGFTPKVPQPIQIAPNQLMVSSGYGLGCKLLEIERSNDNWSTKVVWSSNQLRPKFTNPVVHDGHLYGLDDGIALACLDLATGERKWKKGRYGHGQLLLVHDLILVQMESGEVALVEASPKAHHELARFAALSDQTWNNPVLVDRWLLVRNDREAACYELPLAP